jgi:GNAT superfamily N-acetyltransferase
MIEIRTATLDDAAAVAALRAAAHPFQVRTAAGTAHWWVNARPEERLLVLVAADGAEVVGFGSAAFNTWTERALIAEAQTIVHPTHRGRGIGRALWERLAAHVAEADTVQAFADDDRASRDWCARRGFETTAQLRYSRLDLTAMPAMPAVPAGVTFVTGADLGPVELHRIDAAAIADEPGEVANDAVPYDDWRADMWESPMYDWELATVALVDGVPAAHTKFEVDPPTGRVWSAGTGTLREYRGRGLAKLVKSVSLRKAAEAGYTAGYTCNDETNAPMLAINAWLGYQPAATLHSQLRRR